MHLLLKLTKIYLYCYWCCGKGKTACWDRAPLYRISVLRSSENSLKTLILANVTYKFHFVATCPQPLPTITYFRYYLENFNHGHVIRAL